jgi:hypothetical protein
VVPPSPLKAMECFLPLHSVYQWRLSFFPAFRAVEFLFPPVNLVVAGLPIVLLKLWRFVFCFFCSFLILF